mmetsp:Transcript_36007/g.102997  ORF Transcript_36007/g.102997 Transcript_36007/m.102997 type:complete len:304 (-) Transcript_36007:296-1207(-)
MTNADGLFDISRCLSSASRHFFAGSLPSFTKHSVSFSTACSSSLNFAASASIILWLAGIPTKVPCCISLIFSMSVALGSFVSFIISSRVSRSPSYVARRCFSCASSSCATASSMLHLLTSSATPGTTNLLFPLTLEAAAALENDFGLLGFDGPTGFGPLRPGCTGAAPAGASVAGAAASSSFAPSATAATAGSLGFRASARLGSFFSRLASASVDTDGFGIGGPSATTAASACCAKALALDSVTPPSFFAAIAALDNVGGGTPSSVSAVDCGSGGPLGTPSMPGALGVWPSTASSSQASSSQA